MIISILCVFSLPGATLYIQSASEKKEKKGKKKKHTKKKQKTRVNANMQLCLFIPIGMIKCWFGMVHKQLR